MDDSGSNSAERVLVVLPFEPVLCPVCLSGRGANYQALSLKDYLDHLGRAHAAAVVAFQCRKCKRVNSKKHSIFVHISKCRGETEAPTAAPYPCRVCGEGFSSKIGLGQHERHRHPVQRNEARAPTPKTPQRGAPPDEGLARLAMLEVELESRGGVKFINKELACRFGSLTPKQISDRRRSAAYRDLLLKVRGGAVETPPPGGQGDVLPTSQDASREEQCGVYPDAAVRDSKVEETTASMAPQTCESDSDEVEWREEALNAFVGALPTGLPPEAEALVQACREAAVNQGSNPDKQGVIDGLYDLVIRFLAQASPACAGPGPQRQPRRKGKGKKALKRFKFGRVQELFKRDPRVLAKRVLQGLEPSGLRDGERDLLEPCDVRRCYQDLWGVRHLQTNLDCTGMPKADEIPIDRICCRIACDEVGRRVRKIKSTTAPGPDGINIQAVRSAPAQAVLSTFYSLILLLGRPPAAWRENRSVLIPKEGYDVRLISNYRPLTIGSILSRIFWGIIDRRLRELLKIHRYQKGFTTEPGCYQNVRIFSEVLRQAKSARGLVAVQLDISKAFDTVPHAAIATVLRQKGLPPYFADMVRRSYEGAYTSIRVRDHRIQLELKRGVKQGDPISPLLFNMIMEPLLNKLESLGGVTLADGSQLACLAFADDLILLADNRERARELLETVEEFLDGLGMKISAPKSVAFEIVPTKDSWCVVDPGLRLRQGGAITYAGPDHSLKYLGVKVSPWVGVDVSDLRTHFSKTLEDTRKLPLKPHQKLHLLKTYLIPHFTHRLVSSLPSIAELRALDLEIRGCVKQILHLHPSTADGMLYSKPKDGGLGIPCLEVGIVCSALKMAIKTRQSDDPTLQALDPNLMERMERYIRSIRISELTVKAVNSYARRVYSARVGQWSNLPVQGRAVKSLTGDRIGNSIFYDPSLLKPCRFITALRLRSNTGGNRTNLSKIRPLQSVQCRRCGFQRETLGHILGQCLHTKAARIRRHDAIKDFICDSVTREGDKTATVTREPELLLSGDSGKLKPDLVITRQGRVFVVDVTVRHEDSDYLERARREKIDKYQALLPSLIAQFGATGGEVLPIVVGTRGAMPKLTMEALAQLGITERGRLKTISLMSLRSSIEIYHGFLDYDASLL